MDKPFVIFAVPTYTKSVCTEFLGAAVDTQRLMIENGIDGAWVIVGGDPYLAKVRSKIATRMLKEFPQATELFFLDDDVGWPAQKVIDFIKRPEPIIVGMYPKKSEALAWPLTMVHDEHGNLIERDGLYVCTGAGTGFMRIKRHVLEKMTETCGTFIEREGDHFNQYWNLFQMGRGGDGQWWGEDTAFCMAWNKMGGEVLVDPHMTMSHRGSRLWTGTFAESLPSYEAQGRRHAIVRKEDEDFIKAVTEKAA